MVSKKVTHGIFWSAIDVLLRQGVQFVVLILMARLLAPEDFGVIALLALFVALATIFVDGGFGAALIQKQNTTRTDESTVFYFNFLMALMVASLLALAAPWIAVAFDKPVLRPLAWLMALNVAVNAFGAIHTTLLTKAMNFKLIAKVSGIASLLSGALALALAANGFGVWSLAAQTLTSSLISVVLLWLWHDWRPAWTFSFASLQQFFRFGGYLLIIGIVDALHSNLYAFLIGKYYSVRSVGFYDRAQKTQLLPVNLLMLIINRVAFSTFSAAADDKARLARSFRKAHRLVMFVNIPLAVMMVVLAEPIILLLFGENWLDSAPILQVLGLEGLLWPMHMLNANVLKAQGRSDLYFNVVLIKKSVAIVLIIIASFYGILAIAWAQVLSSLFAFVVNTHYSHALLGYGGGKQMRDIFPNLMGAILAGLGMWVLKETVHLQYQIVLALALLFGVVIYLITCFVFRVEALQEVFVLLVDRRFRKK